MTHMPNLIDIKLALKKKSISQLSIAKILNVHPVTVNEVVQGKRKNPRIRLAIALSIGKPVCEIWPEEQKNTPIPATDNLPVSGDVVCAPEPSRDRGLL